MRAVAARHLEGVVHGHGHDAPLVDRVDDVFGAPDAALGQAFLNALERADLFARLDGPLHGLDGLGHLMHRRMHVHLEFTAHLLPDGLG